MGLYHPLMGLTLVVFVLTLTRIIKSVVAERAPVTLDLTNTQGKARANERWYTQISQLTQFMPPPGTYKSRFGSQPMMCQVHTGAYVSLLAPEKSRFYRLPLNKDYHVYSTLSTYITTHTYARQTHHDWKKKQRNKKVKGCKERTRNERTKKKGNKGKDKPISRRQDKEKKHAEEERKKCHTRSP